LRRRNDELASQLRESRKEEILLKNRLNVAKDKIKELSIELSGFRVGSDSKSLPVGSADRSALNRSGSRIPSAVASRVLSLLVIGYVRLLLKATRAPGERRIYEVRL